MNNKQQVLSKKVKVEDFFLLYLELLKDLPVLRELAPRERQFIALLMRLKYQYKDLPKNKSNALIFGTEGKKEISQILKIQKGTLENMLSKLRKTVILNKYELPHILNVYPDKEFNLIFNLKIDD